MKPALVVLAAGMGSRFGGVKQIEPVGPSGEIILEYSVFDAIRAGFGKVVFVLRKDIVADFKTHILPRFEKEIQVEIVLQELDKLPGSHTVPAGRVKPWGTGHAVLMAKSAIKEPFAVIKADDFYGFDGYRVMGKHLLATNPDSSNFSMVGYELRNTVSDFGTVSRGICQVNEEDCLSSVVEHTKLEKTGHGIVSNLPDGSTLACTGKEIVSMNLFGFTPQIFTGIEEQFETFMAGKGKTELNAEIYIPYVVNTMIQRGQSKVKMLNSNASWFGITYKEDLQTTRTAIKALVTKREYPEQLWKL